MNDIVKFIEKYCLVNGKHIKLNDYQINFIKWLNKKHSKNYGKSLFMH